MSQKNSASIVAGTCLLAGLLSLSASVPAQARPHRSEVNARRVAWYPRKWPRRIPILVGDIKSAPLLPSYIKGPEYWHSLTPAERARLKTFAELRHYCQKHQGTWPLSGG